MVDGNRQFVAVLGELKVRADEPGMVDQQIDALIVGEQGVRESAHRGEAGQIGKRGVEGARAGTLGDEPPRSLGTRRVASNQDDPHSLPREAERGVKTDPDASACNDRDPLARRAHRGPRPYDLMTTAASKPVRNSMNALAGADWPLAVGMPAK